MRRLTASWLPVYLSLTLMLLLQACGSGDDGAASAGADAGFGSPSPDESPAEQAGSGELPSDGGGSPRANASPSAEEAEAAAFFEGETIEFVVPYDPGGGYDTYVRAIAPYFSDCTGSDVVVVNEPGAGSLLATNQTAVAEPSGLRIQILNTPGAASAQLAGAQGVNFDLGEFSWIGRVASLPNILATNPQGPFQTFQAVLDAQDPVRFAATGPGSNEYVVPVVLSSVYGFPIEIVTGFAGSQEARLSVIQGDVHVHNNLLDSTLPAIESGEVLPILQIGSEPSDIIPDVPSISEFPPSTKAQQEYIDILVSLIETDRAVAAPPGLPENRLRFLRSAFACALTDEQLVAQLENQGRPVIFLPGEEIEGLVENVVGAPADFREVLQEAF